MKLLLLLVLRCPNHPGFVGARVGTGLFLRVAATWRVATLKRDTPATLPRVHVESDNLTPSPVAMVGGLLVRKSTYVGGEFSGRLISRHFHRQHTG